MEWYKIFSSTDEALKRIKPSNPQLVIIGGTRICLTYFQGEFLAVQDACSHNGESLSNGKVNYLGEIICPWHNYRFDLKTGLARDSSCAPLKTFPTKADNSGFFIGI